jgi:hydroxymethylpyrimidine/phosphomethylpyrimidine kinase
LSNPAIQTSSPAPVALTIAGSDSGAGAGLQADLKTFSALGVYGVSVVTAVTAQNTLGVSKVAGVTPELVTAQLDALFDDFDIAAAKTGMLFSTDIIRQISEYFSKSDIFLIVDPVMVATSGAGLIETDAVDILRKELLPVAGLVTPNLEEAATLLGCEQATSIQEMEQQARRLLMLGCQGVLLKGGHLDAKNSADIFVQGDHLKRFEFEKVDTINTHGTGCTLSAAVTANLAKGYTLEKAVAEAKHYTHSALIYADRLGVGKGTGPLSHFHKFWNTD